MVVVGNIPSWVMGTQQGLSHCQHLLSHLETLLAKSQGTAWLCVLQADLWRVTAKQRDIRDYLVPTFLLPKYANTLSPLVIW